MRRPILAYLGYNCCKAVQLNIEYIVS